MKNRTHAASTLTQITNGLNVAHTVLEQRMTYSFDNHPNEDNEVRFESLLGPKL